MKRPTYISVYLHESEKELISNTAKSMGKESAALMREVILAYCQKRIGYTDEIGFKEEFSKNQQETLKQLEKLQNQMKEIKDLYEIDLSENLESISKLDVEIDISIIDKVLFELQKSSMFLADICENLGISPKIAIKVLTDLKTFGRVDQLQDMKWRLIK